LNYDRTHIFNASYVWEVPDGARGPFDHAGIRSVLNGWKVSGITTMQSGVPLIPNVTGDYNSASTLRSYFGTPSGTLGLVYLSDPRAGGNQVQSHLLNGHAFAIPSFGNLGTYQSPFYLRGPARFNTDITLFKTFNIHESQNLELRFGFFNIFNQAYANPNLGDVLLNLQTSCNRRVNGVPDGNGGTNDNVCDPTGGYSITNADTFGLITGKHGHRIIEFALKYNF